MMLFLGQVWDASFNQAARSRLRAAPLSVCCSSSLALPAYPRVAKGCWSMFVSGLTSAGKDTGKPCANGVRFNVYNAVSERRPPPSAQLCASSRSRPLSTLLLSYLFIPRAQPDLIASWHQGIVPLTAKRERWWWLVEPFNYWLTHRTPQSVLEDITGKRGLYRERVKATLGETYVIYLDGSSIWFL